MVVMEKGIEIEYTTKVVIGMVLGGGGGGGGDTNTMGVRKPQLSRL